MLHNTLKKVGKRHYQSIHPYEKHLITKNYQHSRDFPIDPEKHRKNNE